jgi:hypothetical protein
MSFLPLVPSQCGSFGEFVEGIISLMECTITECIITAQQIRTRVPLRGLIVAVGGNDAASWCLHFRSQPVATCHRMITPLIVVCFFV